jgi:hypothetical protein
MSGPSGARRAGPTPLTALVTVCRGAYNLLTHRVAPEVAVTIDLIWHKLVPLKVSVLAWRLLRNRLPTRNNLMWLILFLMTPSFVWLTVVAWKQPSYVPFLPHFCFIVVLDSRLGWHILDRPFSYTGSFCLVCPFSRGQPSSPLFHALRWLCCIWVAWQEWNSRIFKAKESTVPQLLVKVKVHFLWWMKAYNVNIGINSHIWWSNPFVCLGIG